MFQEIAEHNYYNVFPSLNSLEVKRGTKMQKNMVVTLNCCKAKIFQQPLTAL